MTLLNNRNRTIGLVISIAILGILFMASNVYGYTHTTWTMVFDAYFHNDASNEHLIIRSLRLSRALAGVLVGAALAISGALMQAITRNPMASPEILGVNAGASLFIVTGVSVFSLTTESGFIWFAFSGAAIAAASVFWIGSLGKEGMTPIQLTLTGVTITALCSSYSSAILVSDERTLESVLFWLTGSIESRKMEDILPVIPFLLCGYACALGLGKALNVMAVGDEVAKGLGQHTIRVKTFALFVVILLSGGAVAVAGPVGFIGLIIPHLARKFVGLDHRWIIPYCAVFGGILLLVADIAARFVAFPKEIPVGVMTAIVGAPFFIYLARKGLGKK
ncbi:iron ABC transporter permease [Paenibacillus sp. FSL L8-0158]|uniref:FecCD family ABC transporter permease n=1 Tax=Paenibacillus sp. FSL L8-0158 TaxID=2954752 RepID=UPI0031587BC7